MDALLKNACRTGDLEVMKYLYGSGADIHAYSDGALRLAAECGHLEVVEYLRSVALHETH